jgi:hypothetical protein
MLRRNAHLACGLILAASIAISTMLIATPANAKSASKTVTGPTGQTLSVSATEVRNGQVLAVTGNKYNKKIGIYLAFCVVNAKGVVPGPCGGGVNSSGTASGSIWISSNPPAYGKSIAKPFSKSGGFKQSLTITRYIGSIDCAVIKCAVVTRADHTKSSNRKADVMIPVKFKK